VIDPVRFQASVLSCDVCAAFDAAWISIRAKKTRQGKK
jgi:hypothetical protein